MWIEIEFDRDRVGAKQTRTHNGALLAGESRRRAKCQIYVCDMHVSWERSYEKADFI